MSITTEQYLALSQFAYTNFSQADTSSPKTISYLISNYEVEDEGQPVLDGLNSISDWQLVGFQSNTANGFAAGIRRDWL